jgi:LEA14-like dessication related protein
MIVSSCSVVQQTTELTNFAKCEFRIESVKNTKLAGINVQDKDVMSDFSFIELTKIGSVVAGGTLPLTFDLMVGVKNPNPGMAAMNKMDWILFIDDIEMTRGVLDKRIEIKENSVSQFPVKMNLDLMKSLSGKSGDALINFALNLAGNGNRPTRVKLKAKPTIMLGTTPIEYPGFITIKQDFGSQ